MLERYKKIGSAFVPVENDVLHVASVKEGAQSQSLSEQSILEQPRLDEERKQDLSLANYDFTARAYNTADDLIYEGNVEFAPVGFKYVLYRLEESDSRELGIFTSLKRLMVSPQPKRVEQVNGELRFDANSRRIILDRSKKLYDVGDKTIPPPLAR